MLLEETDFPTLKLIQRGKVRDMYDLGDAYLMVATDRMSAFDVVLPDPIPDKGIVLTQISLFWFDIMAPLVSNHIITADVSRYPESCRPYTDDLRGRSIVVKKAQPLPVECVVRGYITGSGWKSYKKDGTVCGIHLPDKAGRIRSSASAYFHPVYQRGNWASTISISILTRWFKRIGAPLAEQVRDLSLAIYE